MKKGIEVENIKFATLPSCTVISTYHRGNYDNLKDAHFYLIGWLDSKGYKINGSPRSSYIDGIWNKQNEADWLTEVQFPIIKD